VSIIDIDMISIWSEGRQINWPRR